jgi:hypothetical protein
MRSSRRPALHFFFRFPLRLVTFTFSGAGKDTANFPPPQTLGAESLAQRRVVSCSHREKDDTEQDQHANNQTGNDLYNQSKLQS